MLNAMEVDVMKHARVDLENKLMQRNEDVRQLEVQRSEVRSNIFPFTLFSMSTTLFSMSITLFSLSFKLRAVQEANDATARRKQIEADREERVARTKRKDKRQVLQRKAVQARKEASKAKVAHQVIRQKTGHE
jgi:hypothetical protein